MGVDWADPDNVAAVLAGSAGARSHPPAGLIDAGPADAGLADATAIAASLHLDDPVHRGTWLALGAAHRRVVLAAATRNTYAEAREWAGELIAEGRVEQALSVLDDLLAVAGRTPFAQADTLRALHRLRPPLDVEPERVHAYVDATLRDVRQRPSLLRVVPDLLRYAAQVLFALGDRDGVVRAADLARTHGARLARGFGAGPLERIRDDPGLAPMWAHPGYAEVFAHLPPAVFTDPEVAVSVAEHVRHVRLRRPLELPAGMDRLVNVEVVELEGAGDASASAWLAWLATRPSLHTLELTGAAQRLVQDADLLAALLVAPGLRRLRIGFPPINPWSMRALLADLRRTDAPPRTRLLHLALLREDVDYVLAHARTADLVAALDSGVVGVRAAALHLLDGVFGAPAVRFAPGDEVLVVGRLKDPAAFAALARRLDVRVGLRRGPRTRLGVVAEQHGGEAHELLDCGLPLSCEGQLTAVMDGDGCRRPTLGPDAGPDVDGTASASGTASGPASGLAAGVSAGAGARGGTVDGAAVRAASLARASQVSRSLASTDGVQVGAELARLTSSRARGGAFEGLIVVATNPRADRSLRQAARRILIRDAPADLVDAAEDVAEIVRALDRSGSLSTWDLQETGVETDGLVDVVELAVLLMSVRRHTRAHRLAVVRAGLAALPEGIGELQHLRELRLDDNRLTDLPPSVLALRELTELSVAGNRLRTLPDGLAALTELTALDVGHNAFTDLPGVLGRLGALRRLDLTVDGADGPVTWPGLGAGLEGVAHLRELTLDGHDLPELPAAVRAMAGLERLSLRRGRLGTLGRWLAYLPRLGWLALDGTPVAEAEAARQVIADLRARGVVVSAWPTEPGP